MSLSKYSLALAGLLIAAGSNASERNLEQELQYLQAGIQPHLPVVVDEATRLVGASIDDNTFSRTFHLAVPVDDIEGDAFAHIMMPELVAYVCNTDNQRPLLDLGGQYRFAYIALDKEPITEVVIGLKECTK